MFGAVMSATLKGLQVEFVQVEADVSNGLPMFHMVGYLSAEVKEAGERVRTAMKNSGFAIPTMKVVVNLSPANMRKKGNLYDLPIAIAILKAVGAVREEATEKRLFLKSSITIFKKLSVSTLDALISIILSSSDNGISSNLILPK